MKRTIRFGVTYLGIFMLFVGVVKSQDAQIIGNVGIKGLISSVEFATVYLENTELATVTDKSGNFLLSGIEPGSYSLIITGLGYSTFKQNIKLQPNDKLTLDFEMEEAVLDLPPVMVSSVSMTGGKSGILDIPGSVHYISPKEIQKFSYTDINRTLRAVPGINVQEEDGFGLRPNIGLRGVGVERSSKITIMEDGVLMSPAPYTAPSAYYFPTIGRMQAVEVLKGSSQIKYGPYTTGGAINLISTQIPDNFRGSINVFAGSFGAMNMHAFMGESKELFGYSVETYQYKADGFKQLDGGGNTGFDKKDYIAKFRVNTKSNAKVYQSLTFKLGQASELSNETYLGLTEQDFDLTPYRRYAGSQKDQMITEQNQFQIRHVVGISENINLTTTAYRSEFSRNWYKLDKVATDSGQSTVKIAALLDNPLGNSEAYSVVTGNSNSIEDGLFVKANNRSYSSQGIQSALNYKFNTASIEHDLEFGIRLHRDEVDRFQWVDGYKMEEGTMKLTTKGAPGTESNRIEMTEAFSSYIQYIFKYGNLTAIPGLRYESMMMKRADYGKNDPLRTGVDLSERENFVDIFIPGVGIDYKFNKNVSTFAGVHKGFSPPGSKEGALPEESTNYELGIRVNKQFLDGQVVLYYNDYKNLLGSDLAAAGGGGTTDMFNGGEVVSQGLEFQMGYDMLSSKSLLFSLPVNVVYTYTDAMFENSFESEFDPWGDVQVGDKLPYIANHQLTFILGLEHRLFAFNLSGKYITEMRAVAGQADINIGPSTDAQLIFDCSARYSLSKNVDIFMNVVNFTNAINIIAIRPAGFRPGMPRGFNFGVKARF